MLTFCKDYIFQGFIAVDEEGCPEVVKQRFEN
jgi:hypothetical protein